MPSKRFLDFGSFITIAMTFVLFVVALFVKGLTHDILLEAGVFLVSAKLVLMGYRSSLAADELRAELRAVRALLETHDVGVI